MDKITYYSSSSIHNLFASLSISSPNLDFGPEFAQGRSPQEFASSVNQYLQLHEGNKIKRLRLCFTPLEAYANDIQNWIAFAVSRGVEDLRLEFSPGFDPLQQEEFNKPFRLPDSLFHCRTLLNLSLSHYDFTPPEGFSGFHRLKSLSLSDVKISQNVLEWIISDFPPLESLFLKLTCQLESLKISSRRLQKLVLVVPYGDLYDIEINAPRLQSFIYYGEHTFGDTVFFLKNPFIDISSLTDVYISSVNMEHTEPEHDYVKLLFDLKQVQVLTVCTATLLDISITGAGCGGVSPPSAELLPITLENLKELQVLMDIMNHEYLSYLFGFFHHCPSPYLERLFITLPTVSEDEVPMNEVGEPSEVIFRHLRAIKIVNFKGKTSELRMVKFLLERAAALETMVIGITPKYKDESKLITEKISLFPMASPAGSIVVTDSLGGDNSLSPTHTEYFSEISYFP